MTAHTRAILRHYFSCDNAKETAAQTGTSDSDAWKPRPFDGPWAA